MKMFGPFDFEAVFYMTDGERTAKATFRMPREKVPTLAGYWSAAEASLKSLRKQMGKKWRLCTKREYFDAITLEATGSAEQFALPGGDEWDVE